MKKARYINGLLAVIVAASLQSCLVAKDYERPMQPSEELFREAGVSKDTVSMATTPWSSFFTDPVLRTHIETAISNNWDMRIALQNIAAAESQFKQAKLGYAPNVQADANWTHQEIAKNSQFGRLMANRSIDQYQATLGISWEMDIWGKIRSQRRGAQAGFLQTVAAKQAIQTQLVANVASVYLQLAAVDAQLKVVDSTLINRRKSVEVIRELMKAGETTAVGVKQTEAQLYATEITAADLRTRRTLLENNLRLLLGEGPGSIERSPIEQIKVTADLQTGLPAQLLQNRPDVMAAEFNLMRQFEMVNVARSAFYPSLTISGSGGFQSLELQNWFSANALMANVVTGLTQPIFNRRGIRTNLEVAKSNQEVAYLNFEKALVTAGKEVSDALATYQNETEKLAIRDNHVTALREAASYSEELLTYGMATYLEVLTAKDSALASELSRIDNQVNQYNALITLYRALGGGWK